jgi:CheY-like chemotaxis protein/HPt (histidine-containing phosphotransfer) domain-containing protein
MMGGKLTVDSEPGVGSTFSFTVWLGKSTRDIKAGNGGRPDSDDQPLAKLAGLKILVAEDNPVNRQIAEEFLERQGALVDSVENGEIALNRISDSAFGDHYDLILMDIQMPVMDGFEATQKIRIIKPDIPILAMTARTMANERDDCLKNGMNDHISKPINPQQLYQTILKYVKPELKDRVSDTTVAVIEGITESAVMIEVKSESISFEVTKIEEIDWEMLTDRIGNSEDLILTLLTVFAEIHVGMATDMEAALKAKDADLLKQKLHTAKGVLGNIDATGLYQQVKKIEAKLLAVGMSEDLEQDIKNFKSDFIRFISAIMNFIDTHK